MTRTSKDNTTPGGRSTLSEATKHSDSGELGLRRESKSECSGKLPHNIHTYLATLNIQTLIQVGKLHTLTTELHRQEIQIIALQETRYTDEETIEYNGYRIFKSKTNRKIGKGAPLLGMAFMVNQRVLDSVIEVNPINNRLMTLRLRFKNKYYTLINSHAPTNEDNKRYPEQVEKFWEKLEDTMSRIPKNDVKILLGDFNAQIGKEKQYRKTVGNYPAHKFTNKNGTRLIETCRLFNLKLMSTSKRKSPRKQKTWRSPNHYLGEFQIDHMAITYDYQKEVHNIQVRRGANIDSDHYLTRIKMKLTPQRQNRHKPNPLNKFDLKNIKNTKLTENLENIPTKNWTEFKDKIIREAKALIPLTKKPKHPWWDDTCESELNKRKIAFNKYNTNRTQDSHEHYLQVRRHTNKTIRKTKRKYINDQLKSIEENFRNHNTHDFYKTFSNHIKGYSPQSLCFRKSSGKLALTNKENCQELAQYFNTLLNCPEPSKKFPHKTPIETNRDEPPPNKEEITTHIKNLKNNKTSGEDGIVAELLKALGTKSLDELTQIIQEIWITENIPVEWKTALIHPLHKKGDRKDVNNYRGISLLPVTYKILAACLLRRTQEQVEHKLSEYQAGFRPHRSCAEQILNLKTVLQSRAQRSSPTVCTFVDFKKAYDSIDRQALFNILDEYGLDKKTRNLLQSTLTETFSKVKFMGEISEPFEIKTGVRQGDGLSPLLFNITLDKVMKEWEKELKKKSKWNPIHLGKRTDQLIIPYLAFADDLAIITETTQDAITKVETLKECAEKVGLQISFEKTEFIATKSSENEMKTQYGIIHRVPFFKYLGEILEPTGKEVKTLRERLQKTRKGLGLVQNMYNKKAISNNTKLRHYNTVIKPMILYASETLNMNRKTDLENIKKEERKIIRKILGPRKTDEGYRLQKNSTVEALSNIEEDMRKRRAKFFGHVSRLPQSRLTKKIFTYISTLKQKTNWYKYTEKELENMGITLTDIQDRNIFRNKIHKWKYNPEPKTRPSRPKWSQERREIFSQQMKAAWRKKLKKS